MPGNNCQYYRCGRTTRKFPNLRMYRFPKDHRCDIWIINSGNTNLCSLDKAKLHTKYLCQEHFSPECFVNFEDKKRLTPAAIPYKYQTEKKSSTLSAGINVSPVEEFKEECLLTTSASTKTYSSSKPDIVEVEIVIPSSPPNVPIPHQNDRVDIIQTPRPSLKRKASSNKTNHVSKLKKKASSSNNRNNLETLLLTHRFPSKSSRAIATMQLKNNRRPWSLNEKALALDLFYKSPTAYKFLRLQKVNLPGPSTICHWIGQSKFLPGFSKLFFGHIQKKFDSKDYNEKVCSVCFDEMYIQEFLEYSKEFDCIEGFEDLGQYGRTNKRANCVLVFMARGIYSQWKFPIAYFLSHFGVSEKILKKLIVDVLQKLFEVGLHPKVIICDQGTNNLCTLRSLDVTEENPYFFVGENKIFSFIDVPCLQESIRNNLIGACYGKDGKIIAFEDIKKTYELGKINNKSKSPIKITDAHIYSNSFQKIRVKLDSQLLSHSMSAAIRNCIETGELRSDTSLNTANFIEFISNVFDCLNSKSLYSHNPFGCALTDTGIVKHYLTEASRYFQDLYLIKNGKISQPPCFKGFTQTINGVLQFFECEKSHGVSFLMTSRLNQDVLDKFFSGFRQGRDNSNLTARTIRTEIKSGCISFLCSSKGISRKRPARKSDESAALADSTGPPNASAAADSSDSDAELNSNLSIFSLPPIDKNAADDERPNKNVALEDSSVTYFTRYLGLKCMKKFHCEHCQSELFVDAGRLKKQKISSTADSRPTESESGPTCHLHDIINIVLNILENNFERILHTKKIKFKLIELIKKNAVVQKWLNGSIENCKEHKMYTIEQLLVCKILNKTGEY